MPNEAATEKYFSSYLFRLQEMAKGQATWFRMMLRVNSSPPLKVPEGEVSRTFSIATVALLLKSFLALLQVPEFGIRLLQTTRALYTAIDSLNIANDIKCVARLGLPTDSRGIAIWLIEEITDTKPLGKQAVPPLPDIESNNLYPDSLIKAVQIELQNLTSLYRGTTQRLRVPNENLVISSFKQNMIPSIDKLRSLHQLQPIPNGERLQPGDVLINTHIEFEIAGVAITESVVYRTRSFRFKRKEAPNSEEDAPGKWHRFADPSNAVALASFFQANHNNRISEMGARALRFGNLRLFESERLFPAPDTSRRLKEEEFAIRWESLRAMAKPGDNLLVRDLSNGMSWMIAEADGGYWSHNATILFDGYVGEMLTAGYTIRPMQAYFDPGRYRLGLYRSMWVEDDKGIKQMIDSCLRQRFCHYSYLGALWAGIRSVFGMSSILRVTPNGTVLSGMLYPLTFV